ARLLARLNHPHIVTVFDSGVAGPFAYLLMEFVDGVNLRQAMKAGRFTPPEALALVQDICAALKFAHEQGILHRDIKPENILIDSRGQVKIADFGIAKLTGEEGRDLLTLTQRGFVLGSPHYMAPEQFESPGDVDQRADIYSLGVVLYELLTGELPLGRFAPPSRKSDVDARIDEIVMRTLERERELRFQTVGEVKEQMQAATEAKAAREAQNCEYPAEPPARSAKPSIIWSTLSPALGVVALVGLVRLYGASGSKHSDMPQLRLVLPVSILVLLLVASAVMGAIQSMRALRRLRSTGGEVADAKRSLVTLVIWPSLLAACMAAFSVAPYIDDSAVSMIWRVLLSGLLLCTSVLGVELVFKAILSMKQGFPAGAIRGPVIRFAIAVIISFVCIGAYSWERESTMASYLEPSGTKAEVKVSLAAGKRLSFRLIRVNTAGEVSELAAVGTLQAPDDEGYASTLEIVTTNRWKGSYPQHIEASYRVPGGQTYSRSLYLNETWEFNASGTGSSPLTEGEKQRYEIATRRGWMGRKLETLYVEVVAASNQP
ncbi:MAG: serine/threonine-protein kinase, partial [Verrucomicrobia bacterium]|nr:serine/threonine-protein kinase [Verrucomicrobiota bacterium]